MYEHRYKYGKQKEVMPLATFEAVMKDAINQGFSLEWLAFVTFIHYFGCRKSEAYERRVRDVTVTKQFVIVDFGIRKKHGLQEEPNETPREWYGVEEFLIPWIEKRRLARKKTKKRIYYQMKTGEFKQTKPTASRPNGTRVEVKKKVSRVEKDIWLFPNIASSSAWYIYKKIYGEKYYPHYDRLWRLSKAAQTADNMGDMISAVRRVSGLKTLGAMQAYFGDNKEVGKKAMHTLKDE